MKIAIFGNTAGTDFMVQKLLECDNVEKVYHLHPTPGAFETTRYVPVSHQFLSIEESKEATLRFPYDNKVDLIFPMSNHYQIWSEFYNKMKASNAALLMPDRRIGLLEWSKITGKRFLQEAGIPTPSSKEYTYPELLREFFNIPRPFVLKYDQDWRAGLQTIIITDDNYDAEFKELAKFGGKRHLDIMGPFRDQKFSVEEYIEGVREFSYHALMNDVSWIYLGSARDYKKRYENDRGHNTAGMGSYSPVADVNPVIHTYVEKFRQLLKEKGMSYIGFLYLGIMIDKEGNPIVLEINTRPGDPEIQSIISTIDDNLADLLYAAATNQELKPVTVSDRAAVSIRIVNKEYKLDIGKDPNQFPQLWPAVGDIYIQNNTRQGLLCSVITTSANTIEEASDKLYAFLENKDMGDFDYRKDIGYFK